MSRTHILAVRNGWSGWRPNRLATRNESTDVTIVQSSEMVQAENVSSQSREESIFGDITPPPPPTSTNNVEDDDGSTCSICLDTWQLQGDHRLVSLKCGHLFGDSCIRR